MARWIVRVLVVALLLGGGAFYGWTRFGPVAVAVTAPSRGPAVEAVYGPGTVEPRVMLPIGPKVIGRLERLAVDEGDKVTRGDVLAVLAGEELAASVTEAEARVVYAEAQFNRASELYRTRAGSAATLDEARNALASARASLDRAREQLAEMRLVAPADGIVVRRDGEIGQLIGPSDTLFWLACCDTMRVTAEIDEEDIAKVAPGQKVLIRADAFPGETFEGEVSEITPKGDPVARSFRVRVRLSGGARLMIGMTADVNIILSTREDALLVPAAALDGDAVWVVEDDRLARRPVGLGVASDTMVEVTSGLADDARVVLHPSADFTEGRRVRVAPEEAAPR